MNHTELLALKKQIELELAEVELKLQETNTSFVDIAGDKVGITLSHCKETFTINVQRGGDSTLESANIHDLIRTLTNFATQHNL